MMEKKRDRAKREVHEQMRFYQWHNKEERVKGSVVFLSEREREREY